MSESKNPAEDLICAGIGAIVGLLGGLVVNSVMDKKNKTLEINHQKWRNDVQRKTHVTLKNNMQLREDLNKKHEQRKTEHTILEDLSN